MIKKWIEQPKAAVSELLLLGEAKDIPPVSINPIPVFRYF